MTEQTEQTETTETTTNRNSLTKLKFSETWEKSRLLQLVVHLRKKPLGDIVTHQGKQITYSEIANNLTKLCQKIPKSEESYHIPVTYTPSKKCGRLTPDHYSYLNIPETSSGKFYRSFLLQGKGYDVDMSSSLPYQAFQECQKIGFETTFLQRFIEDKNAFITEMGGETNAVKNLFNHGLNGMRIQKMKNLFSVPPPITEKEFDDWTSEIKTISTLICQKHDVKNVTYWYYPIETTIMCSAITFCKENNIEVLGLVYDGFIPTTIPNCEELNSFIEQQTGRKTRFSVKNWTTPPEEILEATKEEIDQFYSEFGITLKNNQLNYDVSQHLLLNNSLKRCKGTLWFKNKHLKWICNKDEIEEELTHQIIEARFQHHAKSGLVPYGLENSQLNSSLNYLMKQVEEEDNLTQNIYLSNVGYVFFRNGMMAMDTKIFYPLQDADDAIMMYQYIDEDYDDDIPEEWLKELMDKIFTPIFGSEDTINYFITWLARGLAGKYDDKTFIFGTGARDSGKSVLIELIQNAFECYVGTTSGKNLIDRGTQGDTHKLMGWIADLLPKRLVFMSEFPTCDAKGRKNIVAGDLVKMISSGGDKIQFRLNYQDDDEGVFLGRMCMFCNSDPPINPDDAKEHIDYLDFPHKFVKEPQLVQGNSNFKEADFNIKDYIRSDRAKKSMRKLIFQNYVVEDKPPNAPSCIVEANEEAIDEEDTLDSFIKENIEPDVGNFLSTADLYDNLPYNLKHYSKKKISSTMKLLGYQPQRTTIYGIQQRGFTNIRLKIPEEDTHFNDL